MKPVSPFSRIKQHSSNFWNRYESWKEYYFNRPADTGYRMPEICAICGKTGDKIHMARKCQDEIYRCNKCMTYSRPDPFHFKWYGYTLFAIPTNLKPIKDETNDVIW